MRRQTVLLLIVILMTLLTGCLSVEPGGQSAGSQLAGTPPRKITMWNLLTNDRRQEAIHDSIMRFNRSQSDIEIVPYYFENEAYKNKLRVAMLSNRMPDMFYYWSGESFNRMVDSGVVADLSELLNRHPDLRDRMIPEALNSASYENGIYGIPHSIQHVLIWYSQSIFEQYGLTPPDTWEELNTIVERLDAQGIAPIAAGGKDRWPLLHWFSYLSHRLGGPEPFRRAISEEGDFTDASFIDAAELFHQFAMNHAFMPGYLGMDQPQAEEAFLSGAAAMFLQGDWAAARMLEDPRQEGKLGYFRFPTVKGQGMSTDYQGGYSVGWAISSTADLDAAFQALEYLMQPEERERYVQISGTPTTVKGINTTLDSLTPAVGEYIRFIHEDAGSHFGFYDQDIEYRRAQSLLDAVVTLAGETKFDRDEIERKLAEIK